MHCFLSAFLLAVVGLRVHGAPAPCDDGAVAPGPFKTLVPFGDSYTDVDTHLDGGTMWPVYAARYAGADVHSFAVSGAVCSLALTPHSGSGVLESQLPAYTNASLALDPATTLYTLWIGTNDVGRDEGMLASRQAGTGVTIVDVARCGAEWVQTLYDSGARNFVAMNMVPLDLAPKYVRPNSSMELELLRQLVASGNELRELTLQLLAPTLPDAHIAFFNTHGLFSDIIANPQGSLNGTVPLDTTGTFNDCQAAGGCTNPTDRDSFVWNDDLHPTEQVDRILAREIALAISGDASQWLTWIS